MRYIPMLFPVLPYSKIARDIYMGVKPLSSIMDARDPEIQETRMGSDSDIIIHHPVGMKLDPMLGARVAVLVNLWENLDGNDDNVKVEVLRIEKIRDNPQFKKCVIAAGYELASALRSKLASSSTQTQNQIPRKHPIILPSPDVFNYNPVGQGSSTLPKAQTPSSSSAPAKPQPAAESSSQQTPGVGIRPACLKCARKHIAQAIVLLGESQLGYPEHRWLAVGHLAEASEELVRSYPVLANLIRRDRLVLMDTDKMPELMQYFKTIGIIETNGKE